jgi:hypothetical protein
LNDVARYVVLPGQGAVQVALLLGEHAVLEIEGMMGRRITGKGSGCRIQVTISRKVRRMREMPKRPFYRATGAP